MLLMWFGCVPASSVLASMSVFVDVNDEATVEVRVTPDSFAGIAAGRCRSLEAEPVFVGDVALDLTERLTREDDPRLGRVGCTGGWSGDVEGADPQLEIGGFRLDLGESFEPVAAELVEPASGPLIPGEDAVIDVAEPTHRVLLDDQEMEFEQQGGRVRFAVPADGGEALLVGSSRFETPPCEAVMCVVSSLHQSKVLPR